MHASSCTTLPTLLLLHHAEGEDLIGLPVEVGEANAVVVEDVAEVRPTIGNKGQSTLHVLSLRLGAPRNGRGLLAVDRDGVLVGNDTLLKDIVLTVKVDVSDRLLIRATEGPAESVRREAARVHRHQRKRLVR